uniref:ADF-H domain-containing protein n=2 Tax=Timema TaxID=61471 RepID=A0A7R9EKA8_9NEOP|nr:unnamed protein product [Timema monikensis]
MCTKRGIYSSLSVWDRFAFMLEWESSGKCLMSCQGYGGSSLPGPTLYLLPIIMRSSGSASRAVFKFEGANLVFAAKGAEFGKFQEHFKEDDRAFGYIRIQVGVSRPTAPPIQPLELLPVLNMGDEMSKRQKFLFLTWVGPSVGVIKRAKMSTDKAMVKEIIANFAVELQLENLNELSVEYFRDQLNRAGGANYGTGVRDL